MYQEDNFDYQDPFYLLLISKNKQKALRSTKETSRVIVGNHFIYDSEKLLKIVPLQDFEEYLDVLIQKVKSEAFNDFYGRFFDEGHIYRFIYWFFIVGMTARSNLKAAAIAAKAMYKLDYYKVKRHSFLKVQEAAVLFGQLENLFDDNSCFAIPAKQEEIKIAGDMINALLQSNWGKHMAYVKRRLNHYLSGAEAAKLRSMKDDEFDIQTVLSYNLFQKLAVAQAKQVSESNMVDWIRAEEYDSVICEIRRMLDKR